MKLITFTVILFFGCLITLSSCTADEDNSETVTMKVNHFKQSGESVFPFQFLLVQEGDAINNDTFDMFYDDIKGFNYELGYFYTLKVEKETIENPTADGSTIQYKLIEEISKKKAVSDLRFHILLSRTYDDGGFQDFFKKTDNETFQLFDGTKINCGSLCDQLAEKLAAKDPITGVFKHSNLNELLLIGLE